MARRKVGPRAWVRVSHRTRKFPADRRRWEVVYEDPTSAPAFKKRTKGGFHSKGDAERWRDQESPAAKTNAKQPWVDAANGDVTFQSVAEEWLGTYVSKSGKARGRAQHSAIINGQRSLVRTRWGARRIGDISHGEVAAWLAEVSGSRSDSTVRHNFYTFRRVIRYAVANSLILRDPTCDISLPEQMTVKEQQAVRYALVPAQVQALIKATPEPWSMYLRLAAATGMRPEELTGLQLRDIAADAAMLHIKRVWVKDDLARAWVYEDAGKTPAARRTLRLDDFTAQMLREYLSIHADRSERFFDAEPDRRIVDPTSLPLFPGEGPLTRGEHRRHGTDADHWEFVDAAGLPIAMRHAWFTKRYWSAIREQAGVPESVVFYDLRHFYGSWHAARLGQPGALTLAELAESMGHASTYMTLDRYVHVEPNVDKRNAGAGMWGIETSNVVALRPA